MSPERAHEVVLMAEEDRAVCAALSTGNSLFEARNEGARAPADRAERRAVAEHWARSVGWRD